MVEGTEGYEKVIPIFLEASRSLSFSEVCRDFLQFLPSKPARVLDVGSGVGQNAFAMAELAYEVTAVEPLQEFLDASIEAYGASSIRWLQGSFPDLACLTEEDEFDFVLINAVWHHLNESEREQAINRLSKLVKRGGRCAISLRNGPVGVGTRVYPTDVETTIRQFQGLGFECLMVSKNQASMMKNKEDVVWARAVFERKSMNTFAELGFDVKNNPPNT